MEANLQAAHRLARANRAQLAGALAEVCANLGIARSQRRRQGLAAILATLQQLRGVAELHEGLRCARALRGLSWALQQGSAAATARCPELRVRRVLVHLSASTVECGMHIS